MCLSKGITAIQESIDAGLLPNKKIGFIPTAGEPYENPYFVEESRKRLKLHDLEIVEIDITHSSQQKLINTIENVDALYVAGGNVFWLLQQLIKKDLLGYIHDKVRAGLPYFGESAGAVLLANTIEPAASIDNPQDAKELKTYDGLSLISFFPLPHVGKEKYRARFDKLTEEYKEKIDIVQYTDEQAIIIHDGSYRIVDSPIENLNSLHN